MKNKDNRPENAAQLRRQAEEMVLQHAVPSPGDMDKVLHELRVHQIELQLQNEELRTAQAELDAERARYFDLYDQAPVGYCTVSEQGLIQGANLTLAMLLGVVRGDLVSKPISRFIFNEDQDSYYLHRKQLLETREPQAFELRMVKKDGSSFWAQLQATVAEGEDGARVCRFALSDATERKRLEELLGTANKQKAVILSSISDAFFSLDANMVVTYFNPAAEKALGRPVQEVLGHNLFDVFPEARGSVFEENYTKALKERIVLSFEVYFGIEPYANWYDVRVYPFSDGISVYFRITTERKQAEDILRKGKEDAEAASKAKSEFLNNIAHDFRTPMHAIMGLSTFFQSEKATPKQREYANIINEKSKGLLTLIEELLDVSRLDAGKLELRSIEFDLKESVLEVVKAGRTELMGKEVTLACSIADGFPRVKGDAVRFSQILTNLIGNAIKYTDKGEIVVSVARQLENCPEGKCRVRVSVKDPGLGISKDKQELIFDAYTRFQEFNGTRERGGVGLGLYITKTLVELMGGAISVVSEVGLGSEFIVTLDFDIAGNGK